MKLIRDRKVMLDEMVTEIAPLQDWASIFEKSMSAKGLKFVFTPIL